MALAESVEGKLRANTFVVLKEIIHTKAEIRSNGLFYGQDTTLYVAPAKAEYDIVKLNEWMHSLIDSPTPIKARDFYVSAYRTIHNQQEFKFHWGALLFTERVGEVLTEARTERNITIDNTYFRNLVPEGERGIYVEERITLKPLLNEVLINVYPEVNKIDAYRYSSISTFAHPEIRRIVVKRYTTDHTYGRNPNYEILPEFLG